MQAWMGRLPGMLELALVVMAAWMVAGWLLPSGAGDPVITPELQKSQGSGPVDIASLLTVPLFGESKKSGGATAASTAPVVQSRLNIKLLGTVVAEERSVAVVTISGSKEQLVFVIGQQMQSGVTLKSVEANAIVVDHSGKLERIEMEEGPPSQGAGGRSPVGETRTKSQWGTAPSSDNRTVSRSMLDEELGDFSKLLSQARVVPNFEGGKADGFIIQSIAPGSLYEKVGLQNGDIIRKVNGNMINGPQQAMAMLKDLQSAAHVTVEIKRAGSVQELNYNIQ